MAYLPQKPIDEERLRREIKAELERDLKKKFVRRKMGAPAKSCCGCLAVIAILAAVAAAYFLRTGTATLPFLGDIWHKENVPIRWVEIDDDAPYGLGEVLEPKIEEAIGRKISGLHDIVGIFSAKENALIDIALSEEDLSQMLLGATKREESSISYAQAVVEEDFIELFAVFEEPVKMRTRARIVPRIGQEGLLVEVRELILGRLAIPAAIRQGAYDKLVGPEISLLNRTFKDMMPSDIGVSDGRITLKGIDLLGLVRFSQDESPKPESSWMDPESLDLDALFE